MAFRTQQPSFAEVGLLESLARSLSSECLRKGYLRPGAMRFDIPRSDITIDVSGSLLRSLHSAAREGLKSGASSSDVISSTIKVVHSNMTYKKQPRVNFRELLRTPITRLIEPELSLTGVCIHFSATTMGILQLFRLDGDLSGSIRYMRNKPKDSKTGHAWVMYEEKGVATIVDSTHNYMLTYRLGNEARAAEHLVENGRWNYLQGIKG